MDQAKKVRKMYRQRVARDVDTWAAGEVATIGRHYAIAVWIMVIEGVGLLGLIAAVVVLHV